MTMLAVPPISLVQLIISIPLLLVFFFGIGFILNMILKTTWLPIYLFLALIVYFAFQINTVHITDVTWLIASLIGVVGSGLTIRFLRAKGYRMF
ncbi:YuiB family protein [Shimazuella kribbensis]|uniref:YuiB family protein n=1 Tax=Shimazuella kribbensis TaxID=139808 RepID=UPI001FE13D12|nr:YuiB family protein [Shimazuella kribbensis]